MRSKCQDGVCLKHVPIDFTLHRQNKRPSPETAQRGNLHLVTSLFGLTEYFVHASTLAFTMLNSYLLVSTPVSLTLL